MANRNQNTVLDSGLTAREERIFHYFERRGYSRFTTLCEAALKAFPESPVGEALEAFYTQQIAAHKAAECEHRKSMPTERSELSESILAIQPA